MPSSVSRFAPATARSPAAAGSISRVSVAFDVVATAKHVDPSRFGKFPAGNLDGEHCRDAARCDPEWRVGVDIARRRPAAISQGVPLSGTARATVSSRAVRDAAIDLKLASARLTASGNAGEGADGVSVALDAPRLAELAALLPSRVPHPLSGVLRANAVMRGDVERGGLEFQAHGEALKVGPVLTLGTFDARVTLAPAADAGERACGRAARRAPAHGSSCPPPPSRHRREISRARSASVDGTLAQHAVSLAFAGEDLDVDASAHGGIRESRDAAGTRAWTWTGAVDALENRGPWAVRLAAPAALEIARDHVHVGAARLDVADGNVDLAALAWDDGHLSTRGTFAGVPVATLARLGAVKLPFTSTLTLAGDWSLAATPRLNGSVTVRRERGDFFLDPETVVDPGDRAFGVDSDRCVGAFSRRRRRRDPPRFVRHAASTPRRSSRSASTRTLRRDTSAPMRRCASH